jgi:hypothetical protein
MLIGSFFRLLSINLSFTLFIAVAIILANLFIFSILYYLPGPNLSLKFSYKHIIHLTLLITCMTVIILQLFDIFPAPHLSPIVLTNNTTTDFAFHTSKTSPLALIPSYTYILALPFHYLDKIMFQILSITFIILIASYARFTLHLHTWQYFYFVIGSTLIGNIFYYSYEDTIYYAWNIGLTLVISILIYHVSKTKKHNYLVCAIYLLFATGIMGIFTEKDYAATQRTAKIEADTLNTAIDKAATSHWKQFINKAGGYTISYPADLLIQKNNWSGDNSDSISAFELNERFSNSAVSITIFPNISTSSIKNTYANNSLQTCDMNDCHTVPVSHTVVTLNTITADEYSWKDSEGTIRLETVFMIKDKSFQTKMTYPEHTPAWKDIYHTMWKSIQTTTK